MNLFQLESTFIIQRRILRTLTFQLLLTAIQFVERALLDWSEVGKYFHELSEIDAIVCAISKKCMNNAIA